jgi:hypothetical protein
MASDITARAWTADRLALNALNTADLYHPLRAAAITAAAAFTPAYAAKNIDRVNLAIGSAVCEELTEIITDDTHECGDTRTAALLRLLSDLLDLNDRSQQVLIGALFRPDPADWPTR